MAAALYRLCYASRALVDAHSVEMLSIVRSTMRHNAGRGITGALWFDGHSFFQVLEGEEAAVERLFARISRDERHAGVLRICSGPVGSRDFCDMAMKFVDGTAPGRTRAPFDYDRLLAAGAATIEHRIDDLRRA